MKPAGRDFPGVVFLSKKRFLLLSFLAVLCALVTGCPHNDYTVELKPEGNVIERTLTFYRADGSNSNGIPNYETFPSNEFAMIRHAYPVGAIKQAGARYVAKGEFSGPMPKDVGGAGSYTNLATSLGNAGFYVERFRGNDDLAAQTEKRFHAADQIAGLVIGWTRTQFGRDRGYKKLLKFLDTDFRRDLKNAGLYFWSGEISDLYDTNTPAEFVIRFGQYLHERGYLKLSDIPELYAAADEGDGSALLNLAKRFIAEKMGIPQSEPFPKSFAVLTNTTALETSWTNYLARTTAYRAKFKAWEKKKKSDPKLRPPNPSDVLSDLCQSLLEPLNGSGGQPDHLTVTLDLRHAPNQSNGKWRDGHVIWSADLAEDRPLPVLCYASWSNPNPEFQKAHFGKVILDGDKLTEYCLWRDGLKPGQAREWESFLANLQPGKDIQEKLKAFHFTPESVAGTTNQMNAGCKLVMDALVPATNTIPTESE